MNKKAVILLSGGIDSATTLVYAIKKGFECYAISFDYNQKHKIELEYAKNLAIKYGIKKHIIVKINIGNITNSALINTKSTIPKYRNIKDLPDNIPVTYVPARNTLFLSYALSWAESLKITNIFVGANKDDNIGYPDCRPDFFKKFEELANIGTSFINSKEKIKILTPFINSTKDEIINFGINNNINYSETFTCYDPIDNKPCGQCYSCIIRNEALKKNNRHTTQHIHNGGKSAKI
jgi:7-cyano-7-deazaguanine synthase